MTKKPAKSIISDADRFDAISAIIGQIGHDFNNLLTPLLAYPELIRSDLPEGCNGHGFLNAVEQTAKDMVHITRQLLALSSSSQIERQVFNINPVIGEVISELKDRPIPEGIAIQSDLAEDLAEVEGSVENVRQALENLCWNAIEAMAGESNNRCLLIKTENLQEALRISGCGTVVEAGAYVKVSVKDTGSGIPDKIRDTIFDPFVSTRKGARRRGAGLGLSIVYRIMRDHKGYIDFHSVLGQETTFSLYFPQAPDFSTKPTPGRRNKQTAEETKVPKNCDKGRVLIVDDEKTILKVFQMILSSALPDCKIDLANNGVEAVEAFRTGHNAVVVMDLHMPVMDGQTAFGEIEKLCADRNWEMPSVVFCTGFSHPETVRNVVAGNSAHFLLSKPVRGETLVNVVKSRLE